MALLLTTVGAKSGQPSLMPLLYGKVDGGYAIIASKGGADQHPLRALMESAAEIGRSWSPESDRDGRVLSQIQS